jgi:riboflavin biosynthesis pyrimidine reductase
MVIAPSPLTPTACGRGTSMIPTAHVRNDGRLGDPTRPGCSGAHGRLRERLATADKIVYSTTLPAVSTANTRLDRRFDPDSVRDMKTSAASDVTVGGPTRAAHAFNAGLVDECHLFMYPVLVG